MGLNWLHCTWRKDGLSGGHGLMLQIRNRFRSPRQYLPPYFGLLREGKAEINTVHTTGTPLQ